MKVYKTTDKHMKTFCGFQWEINNTKETNGKGEICSHHFLHFYHDPLIAAIMHPILYFNSPRLFEANADGVILNDFYRKGGCSKLTLIKEINFPQFTPHNVSPVLYFLHNKFTKIKNGIRGQEIG